MMKGIISKIGVKKSIFIIISFAIILGSILGYTIYDKKSKASSLDSIQKAFMDKRIEVLSNSSDISLKDGNSSNKQIRIIVQFQDKAAIDLVNTMQELEDTAKMRSHEENVLNNQKAVISKIESITGNKVITRTAYLMNSICIQATREDIKKICDLKEVYDVYKSETYEAVDTKSTYEYRIDEYKSIEEKVDGETHLTEAVQNSEKDVTGKGMIVAVIDTGVNYFHQDMKWDDSVTPKYTKEEWEQKIQFLGYGRYYSNKVPFAYNYVSMNENVLDNTMPQGYAVSAVLGGKGQFTGVAPNAQIIALKAIGKKGGTTDKIVKALEDAVKLGADVVNMSFGSSYGVSSKDDFESKAIRKACEKGVVCCVAAGDSGTIDGVGKSTNNFKLTDVGAISSPGIAEDALTVASAYVSMESGRLRTYVSEYSAWGTTNDLGIKPEITAPGHNILVAHDGEERYDIRSGTAMATPYVTGAMTLLINNVKSENIKSMVGCGTLYRVEEKDLKYRKYGDALKGEELVDFVKNSMMNTATPILDTKHYGSASEIPYSIRQQGAGMINVKGALENKVLVTYNGVAKIELGEIKGSQDIEIKLTNYGNEDATYTMKGSNMFEPKDDGDDYYMQRTNKASLNASGVVKVPARETILVKVNINVSGNENTFIEGYINFVGQNVPSLSIPVLGFSGDWDSEPIIDNSVYDSNTSYIQEKGVVHAKQSISLDSKTCLIGANTNMTDTVLGIEGTKKNNTLSYNGELNAFSPNNNGIMDRVYAGITQLRNISEIKYAILDENKNPLRVTGTAYDIKRDDLLAFSSNVMKRLVMLKEVNGENVMQWDGTIYDKNSKQYVQAPDGQYYIQLEAKISDKENPQLITMPVKIDTQNPVVEDCVVEEGGNYSYEFKVSDNIALEYYMYVLQNGKVEEYAYEDLKVADDGKYIIDDIDVESSYIMFTDTAGNFVIRDLSEVDANGGNDNINTQVTDSAEDKDTVNNDNVENQEETDKVTNDSTENQEESNEVTDDSTENQEEADKATDDSQEKTQEETTDVTE